MASANKNLHKAKSVKKDEFYTQLTDVENADEISNIYQQIYSH